MNCLISNKWTYPVCETKSRMKIAHKYFPNVCVCDGVLTLKHSSLSCRCCSARYTFAKQIYSMSFNLQEQSIQCHSICRITFYALGKIATQDQIMKWLEMIVCYRLKTAMNFKSKVLWWILRRYDISIQTNLQYPTKSNRSGYRMVPPQLCLLVYKPYENYSHYSL